LIHSTYVYWYEVPRRRNSVKSKTSIPEVINAWCPLISCAKTNLAYLQKWMLSSAYKSAHHHTQTELLLGQSQASVDV